MDPSTTCAKISGQVGRDESRYLSRRRTWRVRFMNKNYAANGVHVPETSQLVCLPKQLTSRWTAKDHHNISRR